MSQHSQLHSLMIRQRHDVAELRMQQRRFVHQALEARAGRAKRPVVRGPEHETAHPIHPRPAVEDE